MDNTVVGILSLLVGIILVMRGYPAMRIAISALGALIGFSIGAGMVSELTQTEFLAGPGGWIGGIIGCLLLGALAFTFYRVGIALGLAGTGYAMGTLLMTALRVDQQWAVIAVGCLGALVMLVLAIALDLPGLIIIIATSLAGADLIVFAVRVLTGNLVVEGLTPASSSLRLVSWWWILGIVLGLVGIVVQSRYLRLGARSSARSQWSR